MQDVLDALNNFRAARGAEFGQALGKRNSVQHLSAVPPLC